VNFNSATTVTKQYVPPPVKFVAQVEPVKEVTLHGSADFEFWQERLQSEQLQPVPKDGRAQVFVSATEAKFLGLTFRECIIGVHVTRVSDGVDIANSMFLLHAWNSLRAFAWIERNFFGTPYYPGQINVSPQSPASFQVSEQNSPSIDAAIGSSHHAPTSIDDEFWQGPIYLPRRKGGAQKLFIAKLAGKTEHFPFATREDKCTLTPTDSCPVIGELLASHFTPVAWHVRRAAAHAKSKTYRAADFFRN